MAILVVDFDDSTRLTFRQLLRKRGFSVDEAKEGGEATRKIRTINYEAVLLSVQSPDMDGMNLLFFLNRSFSDAFRIIISGFPYLDSSIRAIAAGADAYFEKPVKPEELILVIEEKLREGLDLPLNYD